KADFGMNEVMTGTGTTVKLVAEVALFVPTATEIVPVVVVVGTVTASVVPVAEITVAGMPLNLTVLAEGVGLNPCPWIVTVASGPPCCGVKLKIWSPAGFD